MSFKGIVSMLRGGKKGLIVGLEEKGGLKFFAGGVESQRVERISCRREKGGKEKPIPAGVRGKGKSRGKTAW